MLNLTGIRASGPATVSQLTAPAGPPPLEGAKMGGAFRLINQDGKTDFAYASDAKGGKPAAPRSEAGAKPRFSTASAKPDTRPDAPAKPPKALDMVRVLVEGHEAVARTARSLFPLADKASDEPTADLLTQRLTVHEQTAWMLRSLLEE